MRLLYVGSFFIQDGVLGVEKPVLEGINVCFWNLWAGA